MNFNYNALVFIQIYVLFTTLFIKFIYIYLNFLIYNQIMPNATCYDTNIKIYTL